MRTGRVRRQRSSAQRAMLVIIAALTVVISGVAAGLAGYLGASTDAGLRSALTSAPTSNSAYQVSVRSDRGAGRLDDGVREQTAALLPGVAHTVHRSIVTGPRTILPAADLADGAAESAAPRIVFGAYTDLAHHAELVAGRWPDEVGGSDAYPLAVHADAATALGLRIGDEFAIADRDETLDFAIVGLWVPLEPGSAYWGGSPLEIEGATDHVSVLAVAREADLAAVPGVQLRSRWRLELGLDQLSAADVAVLRSALPRLPAELAADPRLAGAEITVDGSLGPVVHDIHDRIESARAVTAVPLVLLGLVSIITIALITRLLVIRREPEAALLRTRGAPAGVLARWTFYEALLVAVVPAALGGGAAWLVLELADVGAPVSPSVVATGAGAAALLVVTTMIATTFRGTAALGRTPLALRITAGIVLIVAVAGVGWQLPRAGTPFVIAVLPALALLAGGLLGAIALPAIARAGQRLAARQRGLTGPLAVREVARRPMAYAVPVTLVVIAVGASTLAAGFADTWSDLQERTAAQRTGADLQVALSERAGVDLQPYRTVSGVDRVTPVLSVPLASPRESVRLIARPDDTSEGLPGVDLPTGSRSVSVEVAVESRAALVDEVLEVLDLNPDDADDPNPGVVQLNLWLADGAGQVSTVSGETTAIPVDAEADTLASEDVVAVALPPGPGPWRLVGIDVRLDTDDITPESPWSYDYAVAVTAVRDAATGAHARLGASGPWTSVQADPTDMGAAPAVEAAPVGIGIRTNLGDEPWAGAVTARLLPATLATIGTVEPLPVVASEAALAAHDLTVGGESTIRWSGGELPVLVESVADVVAGATEAQVIAADLTRLTAIQLSTGRPVPEANQLWVDLSPATAGDAAASATAAAAVTRLAGPASLVHDRAALTAQLSDDAFASQSRVAFWATSGVAILLASAGLAAGAAAVTRRRGVEVTMLRSVGLSASQQSRSRRREQVLVGLSAIGIGAGVGWLVALVLAGRLADTVTSAPTESLHPVPQLALGPWFGLVGTAVVAALAVAVVHGSLVRRQALAATTPLHRRWWWGR